MVADMAVVMAAGTVVAITAADISVVMATRMAGDTIAVCGS
jgi:hypothetical protein